MIRHLEYTRARLAQTSERLRALVYPETRAPDELLVSPAVDRIPWEDAQRLEYRPAELGERSGPLWATYWFESPPGSLVFQRDDVVCLLNVDAEPLELPAGELLLASEPDVRGELPPNTAACVRTREGGRP